MSAGLATGGSLSNAAEKGDGSCDHTLWYMLFHVSTRSETGREKGTHICHAVIMSVLIEVH